MSRALILAIAACCGASAFLWTLLARTPPRESVVVYRQPGPGNRGGRFPNAMRMAPPSELAALESWVRDNDGDYQAWFDIAQRRRAAGDEAGSLAAWAKVAEHAGQAVAADANRARAWYALGTARSRLGEPGPARRAFIEAERRYADLIGARRGDMTLLSQLGWARRGLGNEPGAREAWQQGETLLLALDQTDPTMLYNLACFRSLLGRPEQALDSLALAVENGYADAQWAAADDDLIPIAHDPRFGELLAKMKAQAPQRQNWQEPGGITGTTPAPSR